MSQAKTVKHVPTFCYNCVSGPDLMKVKVEDGVATDVEPNFDAQDIHPARPISRQVGSIGHKGQKAKREPMRVPVSAFCPLF